MVNVLISTYNGETYIAQQIDSILEQTYSDFRIYVRDDGSNDGTLNVLSKYENEKQIVVFKGENIGFGRSFLWLLNEIDTGEYWAFCDQDDVWAKDKLQKAVDALERMDNCNPNYYVHDFYITDEQLNIEGEHKNYIKNYSFQMAITECLHMGFATVFNRKFRSYMLKGDISKLPTHDWWAELIAMEFGTIYVDSYLGAYHRRLQTSVSGSALKNRIKWFKGALGGQSEIPTIAKEFYDTFEKNMNQKDKKVLSLFANRRYNLIHAVCKTCYPKRWRSSILSEMCVRFLMLIGRI